MKLIRRIFPGASLAVALALAAPLSAETVRNHFDTDTMVRPPAYFDLAVLGAPGTARWLVLGDSNAPSAPNCLSQVDADRPPDSIAAAVRRTYSFQDGSVKTFMKRLGGRGGLLLRMAGEKDFVVLVADMNTGDTVLTSYRDGKPTVLGRGRAALDRDWEQFSVVASGASLTVFFRDRKLFEAKDPHPVAGKTGLVAEGPGQASFDEFILDFTPPAP